MSLHLPRYYTTAIPADADPDDFFLRNEAVMRHRLDMCNRLIANPFDDVDGEGLMPPEQPIIKAPNRAANNYSQLINERVSRLKRTRDLSLIPALDTIASRANLTWADFHDVHKQFVDDARRFFNSGGATPFKFNGEYVGLDWAGETRMLLMQLPITHAQMATETLDGVTHRYLDKLAVLRGLEELPDVWLQTTPNGYGFRLNTVGRYILPKIMETWPDSGLVARDAANGWYEWQEQTEGGLFYSRHGILPMYAGGTMGAWPPVWGHPTQNSIAMYAAEPVHRGTVNGVPDPFHIMFDQWAPGYRCSGSFHEVFGHSLGNVANHPPGPTNAEPDAWGRRPVQIDLIGDVQEPVTPFHTSGFIYGSGFPFNRGQMEAILESCTSAGKGQADILRVIPRQPNILPNLDGSTVRPTHTFWPDVYGRRWRINGVWTDEWTNLSDVEQEVTIELRGGVGFHGYVDGVQVGDVVTVRVPPLVVTPPPPPPPAPEPRLIGIEVVPDSFNVKLGTAPRSIEAYAVYDTNGVQTKQFLGAAATYSSANPAVAGVSFEGRVTFNNVGETYIYVGYGGKLTTVYVRVTKKGRKWWDF